MAFRFAARLALAAALFPVLNSAARAQDDPSAFLVKPTEQHKMLLEHEVGDYDVEVRTYMAGPDAEPAISKGTDKVVKVGDVWVLSEFKGDFGGLPFTGRGITGYDPHKKKFVGSWIDSMSASMMVLEGDYDAATKTLTMFSESTDPAGNRAWAKLTTLYKEDGTKLFTLAMAPEKDGEYVKAMEVVYSRKK
jgi:hypothetical protein